MEFATVVEAILKSDKRSQVLNLGVVYEVGWKSQGWKRLFVFFQSIAIIPFTTWGRINNCGASRRDGTTPNKSGDTNEK